MSKEEMKSWQSMNLKLQNEYQQYISVNRKEKDESALRLQKILEWSGFASFIYRKYPFASPYNILKYGLDFYTEKAIQEIDKIANGEIEYELNT
ncbi:MAG: hypothetical protein IJ698_07210 [Prevotella sp.]|nr:hypothetical protein [Prevotella sp.]